MDENVAVTKYIVKFGVVYTLGVIVVSVGFTLLELDHSSGASIGILIASAMYAVGTFIQDYKRLPSKTEKSRLVWSSFFVSWLVSILLVISVVIITNGIQVA